MIDWIPTENLKNERDTNIIVYDFIDKRAVGISIGTDGTDENTDISYLINNKFIVDSADIEDYLNERNFTHYALLTPPQTRQNGNQS